MNVKRHFCALIAGFALLTILAAGTATARPADDVLSPGTYTATVKAIVCGGCGPLIKRTLEGLKQIDSATVDQQAKTVQFAVKKDTTIKVSEIQTALKAAADKMGMGADYTLSDVKAKTK
jgi:hypothetical protein